MSADDIKWAWTDTFMRWLTGCAVLLCGLGFVAPAVSPGGDVQWVALLVGLFLSAGCALCLLLSNASAANAQLYFSTGRWLSGLGAAAIFIGGGAVSMTSMHTGWIVFSGWAAGYPLPSDEHMTWAFGFIAYVKPVVNWNIQALKEIKAERAAAELERAKQDAFDREMRERERQERLNQPLQPGDARATGETARIYRLKPVETARQPVDQPGEAVEAGDKSTTARAAGDLPADLPGEPGEVLTAARLAGEPAPQQPHDAKTFANAEDHARHLISVEGVTKRNELARRVRGLTTYRATQLLDELSPGWRVTKRASAA